jgi:hypothetical protein
MSYPVSVKTTPENLLRKVNNWEKIFLIITLAASAATAIVAICAYIEKQNRRVSKISGFYSKTF